MSDVTTIVDTYLDMWNETDASRRAQAIAQAWVDDGHYVDPVLEAKGPAALSGMVDQVHERFPGHRFRRTSGIDVHHSLIRFGWELAAPDGTVTVAGVDIGVLSDDGRLSRIAGFFGELPESDAA